MDKRASQIATICECIDHCFAYALWCEDFARHVDPDDMVVGLDRAFEVVSDATRLHSFIALRKLDDFLGGVKPQTDDLTAKSLGVDVPEVIGNADAQFLSKDERSNVSKGAAHLTGKLTLEDDSEVDLEDILERSIPIFERLVAELRKGDTTNEARHWLDKTDVLLKHAKEQLSRNG